MTMSVSRVLGLMITIGLLVAGCGKHYWNKPGGTAADFAKDSEECARAHALYMSANKDYAIVQVDPYKACLKTRGWLRAQSPEPPADWFRGIEREEVVRLDSLTPPTSPRRAALTSTAAAVGADLVGTWTGSLVQRSPIFGTRTYAASLRITEVGSALRGALQVSGFDLTGSGDVVRSGTETSLSGRFGRRALPITFTLAVNGTALEANGLGADNQLYRLALERRQ